MPARASAARDLVLCLAWVALIFFLMYYGRALAPWFQGGTAFFAMAGLAACGLAFMAWLALALVRLPAGRRAGAGLGVAACLAGLGLLAWWQPLLIERSHLMLYGVLGILAWRLWGHWSRGAARLLWAGVFCVLVGWVDEAAQYFHPERVFDWRDVITNGASAWLALIAMWFLRPRKTASLK